MPRLIEIDDPDDPRIDACRDIRDRDLIGRAGLFVAEGKVVVEKLVGSARHRPLSLLIAAKRSEALRPLTARLPEDVPVFVAAQPVLDAIAGFAMHRGILAIGRGAEAHIRQHHQPDHLGWPVEVAERAFGLAGAGHVPAPTLSREPVHLV